MTIPALNVGVRQMADGKTVVFCEVVDADEVGGARTKRTKRFSAKEFLERFPNVEVVVQERQFVLNGEAHVVYEVMAGELQGDRLPYDHQQPTLSAFNKVGWTRAKAQMVSLKKQYDL